MKNSNDFNFFSILLGIFVASIITASYSFGNRDDDAEAVESCLNNWKKHPFAKKAPQFRVMTSKVKVFGIGKESRDEQVTAKPELVLVKPNVGVLSKSVIELLNPNGWYCFKGNTSVLGKMVIKAHCKTHLASSKDGVDVLGGSDKEGDVTVLGTSRVEWVNCQKQ